MKKVTPVNLNLIIIIIDSIGLFFSFFFFKDGKIREFKFNDDSPLNDFAITDRDTLNDRVPFLEEVSKDSSKNEKR